MRNPNYIKNEIISHAKNISEILRTVNPHAVRLCELGASLYDEGKIGEAYECWKSADEIVCLQQHRNNLLSKLEETSKE